MLVKLCSSPDKLLPVITNVRNTSSMISRYKSLLSEYVAFQSISTDAQFGPAMEETAGWLEQFFGSHGFEIKRLTADGINPFIFASVDVSPDADTVLIYGHYDVQPADASQDWSSDPFSLAERNGKLFGRGVVDNKGQSLIHMLTAATLAAEGRLGCNVRFLLEGNEESGNHKMEEILTTHRALLAADCILISDGQIVGETPTIEASLRGSLGVTVTFRTAPSDLHSGLYGGAAPNAAHELSKVIAKLYNEKNEVLIPGFYEGLDPITPEQRQSNEQLAGSPEDFANGIGVKALVTEPSTDPITQTGLRPTIQVTGFKSGYIGKGTANIVPHSAEARLNIRVAPSQNPTEIQQSVVQFLQKNAPEYVTIDFEKSDVEPAVKMDVNSSIATRAEQALRHAFGREPMTMYCGGSLPLVRHMKEILKQDPLCVPLGNSDCHMHGADENFTLSLVEKGLAFSNAFLSNT